MAETSIRPLAAGDYEAWNELFAAYCDFYREELPEEVTKETFSRLLREDSSLFCLLAVTAETGQPVGMANCVLHPSTWSREPSCYLEDLFVAEEARGGPTARRLLAAAAAEAGARGADRLYWHTQSYNGRARSLYDQVAKLSSFVVYEQSL